MVAQLLRNLPPAAQYIASHTVDVEQRVEHLKASMIFDSQGVGVVSLWGMGGSGKSTVARAFFAEQSQDRTYERKIILTVGQAAGPQQLVDKQRELVMELARSADNSVAEELLATSTELLTRQIARMLQGGGRLLLVLDDLWSASQLQALLCCGAAQLPPGSQVLLTTRKRSIVAAWNPVPQQLLSEQSATALLAWHACGRQRLPATVADSGAAREALRMCGGLPLAVKVLGGMLRREAATEATWHVRMRPLTSPTPFHRPSCICPRA